MTRRLLMYIRIFWTAEDLYYAIPSHLPPRIRIFMILSRFFGWVYPPSKTMSYVPVMYICYGSSLPEHCFCSPRGSCHLTTSSDAEGGTWQLIIIWSILHLIIGQKNAWFVFIHISSFSGDRSKTFQVRGYVMKKYIYIYKWMYIEKKSPSRGTSREILGTWSTTMATLCGLLTSRTNRAIERGFITYYVYSAHWFHCTCQVQNTLKSIPYNGALLVFWYYI